LPQHCSGGRHFAAVGVDGKAYEPSGTSVRAGAARRCITVWDALSDLPRISSDHMEERMGYRQQPLSHMQAILGFIFKNFPFLQKILSHNFVINLQRYYYRADQKPDDKLLDHIGRTTLLIYFAFIFGYYVQCLTIGYPAFMDGTGIQYPAGYRIWPAGNWSQTGCLKLINS
jgi:hypothetical protein